ncbi:MAG: restriction endonuclease [Bacteroidetes bacterium]|nr:restriction endonuclease [Bacteroidota bacterium]
MKEGNKILITKASGESVPFSAEKLKHSLKRAEASDDEIERIIEVVSSRLYGGISTKRIYKIAFNLLKESSRHLAAKYHLKQAIMELGPSGFPFEKYIGEILRYQGYSVKVGEVVQGKCVKHEIDVIAQMDHKQLMIECKYHNMPGIFCDVKIPLYIQARFKDVEAQWIKSNGQGTKLYQGWVVTNTRFSTDAIQYGTCAGLKLIGWDYPIKGSLKDQIDTLGLYPITCLTSLTKNEKLFFLDKKIVLCKELDQNKKLIEQSGVTTSRMDIVLQEIHQLCKHIINKENTLIKL